MCAAVTTSSKKSKKQEILNAPEMQDLIFCPIKQYSN